MYAIWATIAEDFVTDRMVKLQKAHQQCENSESPIFLTPTYADYTFTRAKFQIVC